MSATCTCTCLGCQHFHYGHAPAAGQDAHHMRLLLALDLSIAAACRSRGIKACNGQDGDDDEPCEIGTLHARTGRLAIALAAMIADHTDSAQAAAALCALSVELAKVIGGRTRVS